MEAAKAMLAEQTPGMILMVDDQAANLQVVGQLLELSGYHVMPALNGEQALARAQARRPDLVLLDMLMPQMSGWEVCRKLHSLPGLSEVPVIFLTAANDRSLVTRAFAEGAVDYIVKPFQHEELLARVKTHIELKRARDRLAEMLREREDVTTVVAHDLKNPLANILFNAQLVMRGGTEPEQRDGMMQDVAQSAAEGLAFIQRYLSRRAEGEYLRKFASETVDLATLCEEASQRQRLSAKVQGVSLKLVVEKAPAWADRLATRNILQNMISNSIRYSPRGEEVTILAGPSRPGYSKCAVADRGPGISETDQAQLFQRFVKLAAAKTQAEYSSGLGLAIAKHDIAQMGGHLWYELRNGGGSVFTFELPQTAPNP